MRDALEAWRSPFTWNTRARSCPIPTTTLAQSAGVHSDLAIVEHDVHEAVASDLTLSGRSVPLHREALLLSETSMSRLGEAGPTRIQKEVRTAKERSSPSGER